jgi:hypothetical protein
MIPTVWDFLCHVIMNPNLIRFEYILIPLYSVVWCMPYKYMIPGDSSAIFRIAPTLPKNQSLLKMP